MGLVFLTVFLDMVGFSVIFPLFPRMLEHYLGREGADSALGQLVGWLASIVGDAGSEASRYAVTVLFGGVLGSVYSLLQFLFAPIWGALSDRHGRRPTWLFTLFGTAVAHVVWFCAGTFGVLVAARVLGGIMAGNVSTASAIVADTSSGKDRAKGMGILGAGIGLGFVIGPALGGGLAALDLSAGWSFGERIGVNPFSACALASFVLALVNFVWALSHFPETLPPERRGHGERRTLNPFRALARIDFPGVRRTNIAYFLYFGAFGAMEFTLTFLAHERLDYRPLQQAAMFVFVGLTIAFVQGGLVRRLTPRYGERRLAFVGVAITLPGFLLVGVAQSSALLYAGLTPLAVGSALVMPSMSSLVSRYTPADRQGFGLGVFRAMGSLARVIGPIVGGILYWSLGSWAPYGLGAAVVVIPLWLTLALPPTPDEPPQPSPASAPSRSPSAAPDNQTP